MCTANEAQTPAENGGEHEWTTLLLFGGLECVKYTVNCDCVHLCVSAMTKYTRKKESNSKKKKIVAAVTEYKKPQSSNNFAKMLYADGCVVCSLSGVSCMLHTQCVSGVVR